MDGHHNFKVIFTFCNFKKTIHKFEYRGLPEEDCSDGDASYLNKINYFLYFDIIETKIKSFHLPLKELGLVQH